jgi:ribose transport system permease protein
VPPFIATLGTLTAGSGLAYVIGGGAPINGLPAEFGSIANTKILGLTIPVLVMIIGIIVLAIVMKRTTYGMRVYAVGGNRNAAEIAGINAKNVLFSVYALSGLLAGISGVMLASRVISGPPNLGQGYELDAIAAVVIGGASLMGGRGTIWGTVLGLFIIQTLNNGLDILVVPAYWQDVIKGVLIVAAVAVDVWSTGGERDPFSENPFRPTINESERPDETDNEVRRHRLGGDTGPRPDRLRRGRHGVEERQDQGRRLGV